MITMPSPPTVTPSISTSVGVGLKSRLASLNGWRIGTTRSTPSSVSKCSGSMGRSSPITPISVTSVPCDRCALKPISATARTTASIDSCGAPWRITTIMSADSSRTPNALQEVGQVVRQRGLELEPRAGCRVAEAEPRRVQELPIQPGDARPVHGVARDGVPDRGEVDADLVRSSGADACLDQREPAQSLQDADVRRRVAARVRDGHPFAVARVPSDRRFYPGLVEPRLPDDEREVALQNAAGGPLSLEVAQRRVGPGDNHQPRRVAIQPVDEPGTVDLPDAQPGVEREEGVDERPGWVAGRRVHDKPGRLVDDEDGVVAVDEPERDRLGLERGPGGGRQLDLDGLAALQTPRRLRHDLANPHEPLVGQARDLAAA